MIKSIDTDIAAIMLGHIHHLQNDSHAWMLAGTGNYLKYVGLTKIQSQLEGPICKSLPGFHATTGWGYNPAFSRKGKLKITQIIEKKKNKNTKKLSLNSATAEFLKMMLNSKIASTLYKRFFAMCIMLVG